MMHILVVQLCYQVLPLPEAAPAEVRPQAGHGPQQRREPQPSPSHRHVRGQVRLYGHQAGLMSSVQCIWIRIKNFGPF